MNRRYRRPAGYWLIVGREDPSRTLTGLLSGVERVALDPAPEMDADAMLGR